MKQIDEIIAICEEVINGDTFLEESIIQEILDKARELKSEPKKNKNTKNTLMK